MPRKPFPLKTAIAFLALTASASAQTAPATAPAEPRWHSTPPAPAPGEYRIVGAGITGASQLLPGDAQTQSPLHLESSNPDLVKAFEWSKQQALAYAHDNGDPVGPWIEGGEPGRESFCMRDMSHQAMGAHALGLQKHIHNMMHRFAENISAARDYCSYWGMTRQNQPRRVDYKDDAHFWYCLPANFDVLDCCYRMYLWSSDESYISDPVFQNYYTLTARDYVERWGLDPNVLTQRPRLLNARGILDPEDKFQPNRGIPGYDEQHLEYTLGLDLVAKEYAGFRAYSHIQQQLGHADEAKLFADRAAAIRNIANTTFWNASDQSFYIRLDKNHQGEGKAGPILLYHNLLGAGDDPAKIKAALANAGADVLYLWGDPDQATDKMLETALTDKARREYPEVSYAWMGTFVNGAMGITLEAPEPSAWTQGYWVQTVLRTCPNLGSKVQWAELQHLPVRGNDITVRHEISPTAAKTTVSNNTGPAFIWLAVLPGSHEKLLVNNKPMPARIETDPLGRTTTSVRVTLGAHGYVTVEVPK